MERPDYRSSLVCRSVGDCSSSAALVLLEDLRISHVADLATEKAEHLLTQNCDAWNNVE